MHISYCLLPMGHRLTIAVHMVCPILPIPMVVWLSPNGTQLDTGVAKGITKKNQPKRRHIYFRSP